ncbi:hypothetical protein ACIPEL_04430 [Streptomyces griseoviridis]
MQPTACTCNHDAFTVLCNHDRDRAGDGARHTPDHSRCHPACANISRTDSQVTALRAEAARIDADAEAGLDPYPSAPAAVAPGPRDGAAPAQLVGEALTRAQGHASTEDAAGI